MSILLSLLYKVHIYSLFALSSLLLIISVMNAFGSTKLCFKKSRGPLWAMLLIFCLLSIAVAAVVIVELYSKVEDIKDDYEEQCKKYKCTGSDILMRIRCDRTTSFRDCTIDATNTDYRERARTFLSGLFYPILCFPVLAILYSIFCAHIAVLVAKYVCNSTSPSLYYSHPFVQLRKTDELPRYQFSDSLNDSGMHRPATPPKLRLE